MKRKIRLSESEFHNLVRKLVKETQNEMIDGEMMESNFGGDVMDAIKGVSNFFKNEVFSDLSDEEKRLIKRKLSNVNIEKEMEKVDEKEESMLDEGVISEGIGDRLRSFFERLGIGTGLGMTASGLLGIISNASGWSEGDILTQVHDIMQNAGFDRYAGPVSMLVIIAGIALAFGSMSSRKERLGK